MPPAESSPHPVDHVIARLRDAIGRARRRGFTVRMEATGGGTQWCIVRGKVHLFLDTGETAGQQLSGLREATRAALA